MRKNKKDNNENKEVLKNKHRYDRGQIFVKIMAGVLAILMLVATSSSLIYSLMV